MYYVLYLGNNAGGSGTYALSGSGLLSAGYEYIGVSGNGSFNQSGGTNAVSSGSYNNGALYLGFVPGSSGKYNLSGSGLLTAPTEYIGFGGATGSFTQSGGTNSVSSGLVLGQSASSAGTYSLNGGLLSLASLAQGDGSATFDFSGGTFQAASTFSTGVPIVLCTAGSNGVFDTNGNVLTLAGVLSGPGGLQKTGSGTLVLGGTNTYLGGTTVNDGSLIVTNNRAIANGSNLYVGDAGLLALFSEAAALPVVSTDSLGSATNATAVAPVPEPGTLALLAAGAALMAMYRKRR